MRKGIDQGLNPETQIHIGHRRWMGFIWGGGVGMPFYLRLEKRMDMVLQIMPNGLIFVHCKKLKVKGSRNLDLSKGQI